MLWGRYNRGMDRAELYRELGRLRALARKQHTTACASCGAPIVGIAKRRYCGNTCAQRARRQAKQSRKRGAVDDC
jgi:hypothetical protein